ncbi:hypothetical protein JCM10914A_21910 [Paenibacillus sp. JCM 10914]|uniref:hypothetical protein n=1 Tax=Paenibacillus sp. JCM 10914 TaxID=1236974 RepID=UPI0003CC66B9|nr:hypothetical protein [Paenibacillus sp. JCM 10914]GAE09344.1 hypothetical protein JCM10914_5702 [Paenibacillus sp. JCM 10914]
MVVTLMGVALPSLILSIILAVLFSTYWSRKPLSMLLLGLEFTLIGIGCFLLDFITQSSSGGFVMFGIFLIVLGLVLSITAYFKSE